MAQVTVDRYALDKVFGVNPINYDSLPTRMAKAFGDSATGIVQNLVEVGADIHDTMMPKGYESLLNPLAQGIGQIKEDIGYRSGIDFQGMQEGLQKEGLSGFWNKFKFEDIPELMAQSFPYMIGGYNAAGYAAISASMAKEMAKNTAINEGRDPNQTTLSDTLKALPAGMAITALDTLVPNTMSANIIKTITNRTAENAVKRIGGSGISNLIKNVAESAVTEAATESMQELIQFAQEHNGKGVFEPEALSQYGVAGLLGGMSGGTMDIALKPVHTIQSIGNSFRGTPKPVVENIQDNTFDTKPMDILNKQVHTDTFQNMPEQEKMNIIDNTPFGEGNPIIIKDNKATVTLNDGSGSIEVDLTISPDATSFGTMKLSDGTVVDLTADKGYILSMMYDTIYNKISSFDTLESLDAFMKDSGLDKVDPNDNVVHQSVAIQASKIQKMLLEEKAKSQTQGAFGDAIDTSSLYGKMLNIHNGLLKEISNASEEQLFKTINRLVFDKDTLKPRNREKTKQLQQLKDLVTEENKYILFKYMQQYGNVTSENTKRIAAFIEQQYGIKTTYFNKTGVFRFTSISEPVVGTNTQPVSPSSPNINIQPTSPATGSDMENVNNVNNKPINYKEPAKTEPIIEESKELPKPKEGVDNGLQEQKTTKEINKELPKNILDKMEGIFPEDKNRLPITNHPAYNAFISLMKPKNATGKNNILTSSERKQLSKDNPARDLTTSVSLFKKLVTNNGFLSDSEIKTILDDLNRLEEVYNGDYSGVKLEIISKPAHKETTITSEEEAPSFDELMSAGTGTNVNQNETLNKLQKLSKPIDDDIEIAVKNLKSSLLEYLPKNYTEIANSTLPRGYELGDAFIELVNNVLDRKNDGLKIDIINKLESHPLYKTLDELIKIAVKIENTLNHNDLLDLLKIEYIASKTLEDKFFEYIYEMPTKSAKEQLPVEEDIIYDVNPTTDTKSINSESILERDNARLARANKFISTGKKNSEEFSVQAQNLNLNHYTDVFSKIMSKLYLSKATITKLYNQSKYASSDYSKDMTFIDTFGLDASVESNTDRRNFFMKTALVSGINAIKNNTIAIIDPSDTDNIYNDILDTNNISKVNAFKGVPFADIISSIANNIAREFRLKPANKDIDPYAVNLQAYQGALYAYAALKELGYLEESDNIKDIDGNVHRFVRITDKGKSTSELFDVFIKEMSSRDVVEPNILGMVDESERNNVDKYQKGTHNIKVSDIVSEALRILQNQDIQINQEMSEIFESGLLDDEEFVNNVIDYENPNNVHINFKENVEAKNASYKYVLGKLKDFVSTTGNQKFWFKYQVNSNGRYQPYATVANPVTDKKFARWMLDNANENSFYEVGKEDNETTYMWKHAIVFPFAEAGMIEYREGDYNVSFEKPDKKDGRANLNAFDKLADLDFMKEAIKLMDKGKKAEAYKIISPAGFHGIRAFIDYYKYYNLAEGETFKTAMPTEVDGLTNGLSQQMSLLGNGSLSNSKDLLNMVGFFTKNQDIKNLYTMRNNGNLDIYEYLSNSVSFDLNNMPIGGLLTSIKAIGRPLTKSPTIVWLYNAGDYGIEMKVGYSITESFLNTIWKNKEKITKDNLAGLRSQFYNYITAGEKPDTKEAIDSVNRRMKYFDYVIDKSMSKELLSDNEFSFLESMFANIVGTMVTDKMNKVFYGLAEYKSVFAKANHFINTVMYAGYKVLGNDIYKHQILIQGNKESKSGISPTREDRVALPEYNIGIKYQKPSGGVGDLSVNPIRKQMQNPTVIKEKHDTFTADTRGQKAGFVLAIHNKDSNDIAKAMIDTYKELGYVGFSIFDASSMSAAGLPVFMTKYNHSTYNNSSTYSIPKAYIQALNYAKKLMEEYPEIEEAFNTSMVESLNIKLNSVRKRISTSISSDQVRTQEDKNSLIDMNIAPYLSSTKSLIENATFDNSFKDVMDNLTDIDSRITAYRESIYNQKLDTALDYNAVQQMSGIEPYKLYKQSLTQGSSSDNITGTLKETRILKKDTNDFVELFDNIKELDEVPVEENHSKYLRDLVSYVQKRLGDYQAETKVDIYDNGSSNAGEYYAENIKLSIGNKVRSYAYQSMQEIYAHELVHKAVDKAFKTDAKVRNELNAIFNKFIDYVSNNATTLPKATFDYILSVNDASEFAAYSVTNKDVMNILEQIPSTNTSSTTGKKKTMFEILSEAVKKMISVFLTATRLKTNNLKLISAKNAREEVDIVIAEMMAVNQAFNSIKRDNIFDKTYRGIGKVNAPIAKAIQATTKVIRTSPIGKAFHDSMVNRGLMYRLANNNLVRAISNEVIRRPKEEENLLKLTKLATVTNSLYESQKKQIANAINDQITNATTQERIALKNILLDLDCSSVFNDANEIGEYLNNETLRRTRIKEIQNSILSMAKTEKQKNYARFIVNQAIGLGYNIATHDAILNRSQLLNANNITNFAIVNHSNNIENFAIDKVSRDMLTKQVDLLATLYGIEHSKTDDVKLAGKYISENTFAIDNILEFQLAQVNRSKQQLFNLKGENHLYMKGYTSTMLNPNDQYTVVESSKVNSMLKQGWKVLDKIIPTDVKFGSQQNTMVLLRRINVDPNYSSGMMSIQSPTSKGTTLSNIGLKVPEEDNRINVDEYVSSIIDTKNMKTGQMIPLLSPQGKSMNVANYRYTMTKNNKIAFLGMINDISSVLAETHAMTERKIRENQDNYDLVKAINKDYREHTDNNEFIRIDNDNEYKDYWRMIPRDTRNYIRNHNDGDYIYVRKHLLDEIFGYSNPTISSTFKMKQEHFVLELMEKIWKDVVGIIRNSIVIKTFSTVYNNMFSNFRSVMLFMPADQAMKAMKEAWVLTDQYRRDHNELIVMEARIPSGKPYDKAKYARIKKAVESNPVTELFQEGKLESVVDDTALEEHDKRNLVEQFTEKVIGSVKNKPLRDLVDTVYIGEDTTLYKMLTKTTIYGDFIARYAIYKHLREEKNLDKDEAIKIIDDMFVKYSVLQNKYVKYLGDLGMFMFSSYYFRIQKGIARALRDKTAYVGSQYAVERILGTNTSDILDSNIFNGSAISRMFTGPRNVTELFDPHLITNLTDM